MIGITFRFGGDIVKVVVEGTNLFFHSVSSGMLTTLEGLKFSKAGIVKEFPDLENDPDYKKKAIERLKEKIKDLPNEDARIEYIKDELTKQGYTPILKQRKGFRAIAYKQ